MERLIAYLLQEQRHRGLGVRAMARQLGISHSTYLRIVQRIQQPSLISLQRIAKGLEVPASRIVDLLDN